MLDGIEIRHLKNASSCGLRAVLCTRATEIHTLKAIYSFSTKKFELAPFVLTKVATLEEHLHSIVDVSKIHLEFAGMPAVRCYQVKLLNQYLNLFPFCF